MSAARTAIAATIARNIVAVAQIASGADERAAT